MRERFEERRAVVTEMSSYIATCALLCCRCIEACLCLAFTHRVCWRLAASGAVNVRFRLLETETSLDASRRTYGAKPTLYVHGDSSKRGSELGTTVKMAWPKAHPCCIDLTTKTSSYETGAVDMLTGVHDSPMPKSSA